MKKFVLKNKKLAQKKEDKSNRFALPDAIMLNIVMEIWLIMKSLFEDKSYTISRSGIIKEDKTSS